MLFVIAYDIADPKRLHRVAHRLERVAQRCQKSVFLFRGDVPALNQLLDELAAVMDLQQDIVQAWKLATDQNADGSARGNLGVLQPAGIVAWDGRHWPVTVTPQQLERKSE